MPVAGHMTRMEILAGKVFGRPSKAVKPVCVNLERAPVFAIPFEY
jgi:hypothetical protein